MATLKRWNEQEQLFEYIQLSGEDFNTLLSEIQSVGGELTSHKEDDADNDVHNLISDGKVIEETGSNSNGEYVRFADGTQICFFNNLTVGAIDLETGSLYRSNSVVWDFPSEFIEIPYANARPNDKGTKDGRVWGSGGESLDVNQVVIRLFSSTEPSGENFIISCFAIGRWK